MIRITYEFATEDDALRFLVRDTTQPAEAPKLKLRGEKKATAPTTTLTEVVSEAIVAKVDAAIMADAPAPIKGSTGAMGVRTGTASEPVKAAPKAPNAPVQAVAELNEAAVRTALRDVVNTKGMKAAAEILKSFSASSISQVKQSQYVEFIKACGK